jgi:hypothetical protein
VAGFTKGPSKKSTKPGGGGRFENCVASGKSKALCASIGRKKFGAKKFSKMGKKGGK